MLQEFDLEIRDKKGIENVVADHLSTPVCLKTDHIPINDDFTYEKMIASVDNWTCRDDYLDEVELNVEATLIVTSVPWYTDFVNYLATNILPLDLTYQEKKKFFHDVKHFYRDEPLMFKRGADIIFHHCVPEEEIPNIITHCHSAPYGGKERTSKTCAKILQAGLY